MNSIAGRAKKCWAAALAAAALVGGAAPAVAMKPPLVSIPYRPDGTAGKLVSVPVFVNGRGSFWFCLDTGAPDSVIDQRLSELLGLKSQRESALAGTGHGAVPAGHPGPQTLRIGSVPLTLDDPSIVDLSQVPIAKDDRGLLGSELFRAYAVRIDPVTKTLSLFRPEDFKPALGDVALPLLGDGRRMYLEATLFVKPGLSVHRRLRIDTGSEDSVDDAIVREAAKVQATTLGNGLGANYQGYSGVYDAVLLGPFRIEKVWGPESAVPAIGMELLRRFVVTFDAPHGRLYLRPTRAIREPVPAPE